jgi:hypothetical protein
MAPTNRRMVSGQPSFFVQRSSPFMHQVYSIAMAPQSLFITLLEIFGFTPHFAGIFLNPILICFGIYRFRMGADDQTARQVDDERDNHDCDSFTTLDSYALAPSHSLYGFGQRHFATGSFVHYQRCEIGRLKEVLGTRCSAMFVVSRLQRRRFQRLHSTYFAVDDMDPQTTAMRRTTHCRSKSFVAIVVLMKGAERDLLTPDFSHGL